jgi:hypothetical protein
VKGACAARIVTRHFFHCEQRVEIRETAATVLHWRGHAEQSLVGQLAEPGTVLFRRFGFEGVLRKLMAGEVGHHALDRLLLIGQLHAQCPTKRGARFSTNARVPSRWSAVWRMTAMCDEIRSRWLRRSMRSP